MECFVKWRRRCTSHNNNNNIGSNSGLFGCFFFPEFVLFEWGLAPDALPIHYVSIAARIYCIMCIHLAVVAEVECWI